MANIVITEYVLGLTEDPELIVCDIGNIIMWYLNKGDQGPQGIQGIQGEDGRALLLQRTNTHIQWQYEGDATWNNLISLDEIQGEQGPAGNNGSDGQEVLLQTTSTHIQYKHTNDLTWTNLVALSDLKGAKGDTGDDGTEIELQTTATHIQWRLVGGTWSNLVLLTDLKGDQGNQGPKGDTGDPATVTITNVQTALNGADAKDTIADTDYIYRSDGSTTKRTLFSVIKSTLRTAFDAIYTTLAAVKADTDIASAINLKHAQGSDIQDLSGLVQKSLYDAQSILIAIEDNTPVVLSVPISTMLGRKATGNILAMTPTEIRALINVANGANNYTHPNHSGDVTSSGDGATTIASKAVTNAKMADMAAKTYKGRHDDSTGAPQDVAVADLKADLSLDNVDNTSDATKNSAAVTLTNKRITKRVSSVASSATPTINTDTYDIFRITALAVDITSMTSGLSGSPNESDMIRIDITGTATRAITWGTSFESSTVTLPTTTSGTSMLSVVFERNSDNTKWRCVGVA